MPLTWGPIEAWEEGTVGWAAAKVTVEGTEQTYPVRSTYVLHLDATNGSSYRRTGRSADRMSRCWEDVDRQPRTARGDDPAGAA